MEKKQKIHLHKSHGLVPKRGRRRKRATVVHGKPRSLNLNLNPQLDYHIAADILLFEMVVSHQISTGGPPHKQVAIARSPEHLDMHRKRSTKLTNHYKEKQKFQKATRLCSVKDIIYKNRVHQYL